MTTNPSLGDDRLKTTDPRGKRVFLHPLETRGFYRRIRNGVYTLLIIVFLVLPWISWNGRPLILLDIPDRSFHLLGAIFKAHDVPIVFLLLATGLLTLALLTALLGRVWCGWACPQTVFIDGIYRKIEQIIQGKGLYRRQLQNSQWNSEKVIKYTTTWIAFFVISSLIAHSFAAYFLGADRLLMMIQQGIHSETLTPFLTVTAFTGILLFNFGWFREQFCIIACPYGRFQSVFMDEKTLSVLYDANRGEPRKSPQIDKSQQGDCVNCRRCVEVCPTGIDIRRGIQMECIGCTACIDACDEIMQKVHKPTGLIRYSSEFNLIQKKSVPLKKTALRPRVLVLVSAIVLALTLLVQQLQGRELIAVTVLRGQGVPYKILEDGRVQNHFRLHFHNQSYDDVEVYLHSVANAEMITPQNPLLIRANSTARIPVFFQFSKENFSPTGSNETLPFEVKSGDLKTQQKILIPLALPR